MPSAFAAPRAYNSTGRDVSLPRQGNTEVRYALDFGPTAYSGVKQHGDKD